MYLADPEPVLRAIAALAAPGGVVSLLARNGDAMAMRPGVLGDWAACRSAFGSDRYENRLGVSARADRLADLTGAAGRPRAAGHRLVRGPGLHRHRAQRRRTAAGPGGPA